MTANTGKKKAANTITEIVVKEVIKIKFVIHGYSPSMLTDLDVIIIQKELKYDAFQALAYDAKSMLGHKDLSRCLGLECNPGTIRINPNDVVLSIITKGGKLPKKFRDLSELELMNLKLKFVCMQFIKQ